MEETTLRRKGSVEVIPWIWELGSACGKVLLCRKHPSVAKYEIEMNIGAGVSLCGSLTAFAGTVLALKS